MLNPSEDRWSWDLNGSGEFSVASAPRYIDNNRLPDISSRIRCIKEVPIKVNVHAWKVRINGLLTRWNISRRGIDIPSILCRLCETGVESSKHLFFNCSVVRAIFRRVCIWWYVSDMAIDSFDEWISWITNLRLPSKHKSVDTEINMVFSSGKAIYLLYEYNEHYEDCTCVLYNLSSKKIIMIKKVKSKDISGHTVDTIAHKVT
nr:RNA-directed DNA polymerase, eukaryota [Tanacetum cinerariifolium]